MHKHSAVNLNYSVTSLLSPLTTYVLSVILFFLFFLFFVLFFPLSFSSFHSKLSFPPSFARSPLSRTVLVDRYLFPPRLLSYTITRSPTHPITQPLALSFIPSPPLTHVLSLSLSLSLSLMFSPCLSLFLSLSLSPIKGKTAT